MASACGDCWHQCSSASWTATCSRPYLFCLYETRPAKTDWKWLEPAGMQGCGCGRSSIQTVCIIHIQCTDPITLPTSDRLWACFSHLQPHAAWLLYWRSLLTPPTDVLTTLFIKRAPTQTFWNCYQNVGFLMSLVERLKYLVYITVCDK